MQALGTFTLGLGLGLGSGVGAMAFGFFRGSQFHGLIQNWPQAIAGIAVMGALLQGGRWLVRQGGRHLAETLTAIPDSGRIVLLLRSFTDDVGFAHLPGGYRHGPWAAVPATEEEQIAEAVAPFGRLVALGRPNEPLPQVGAQRHYSTDRQWQDQVLAGLNRAELVLVACGPGANLRWEVEQVIARDRPERLVLVVVGDAARYEAFTAVTQELFPRGLPDYQPPAPSHNVAEHAFTRAVVWFDHDWTPHLVHLDDRTDHLLLIDLDHWVRTAFPLAIRPVFLRAGVAAPGLPSTPLPRPFSVDAAVCIHGMTALAATLLLLISAADDLVDVLVIVAAVFAPPALLLYRVWRGGHITSGAARFIGLVFGAAMMLLAFVPTSEAGYTDHLRSMITGVLGAGLLTGGLLLTRTDAREWRASRLLFPNGST